MGGFGGALGGILRAALGAALGGGGVAAGVVPSAAVPGMNLLQPPPFPDCWGYGGLWRGYGLSEPLESRYDAWVDFMKTPHAVDSFCAGTDDVLETVASSQADLVTGSALFRVLSSYGCDQFGRFVEVESCGASQAHTTVVLSISLPQRSQSAPEGILHLCRAGVGLCQATFGNRPVLHADTLR